MFLTVWNSPSNLSNKKLKFHENKKNLLHSFISVFCDPNYNADLIIVVPVNEPMRISKRLTNNDSNLNQLKKLTLI